MSNRILPRKDEGIRSTKSSLWMEDMKTLSKNLMYAPLVAYQKASVGTRDHDSSGSSKIHPSEYMSNKKTVPASLRESSLASTLHFVSCDYHRNQATVNDARNNGSRPLGLSDVDERIRQRAVTLVGGGINSSIPLAKKAIRSKKRRQRSWEEARPFLRKASVDEPFLESDPCRSVLFLRKLNSAWNEYAWKVLKNGKGENEKRPMPDCDLNEIEVRLAALVNRKQLGSTGGDSNGSNRTVIETENCCDDQMDLIGAHLKINGSNSHRSWVGRFGVLIGETTNTYRIASYTARDYKKKKSFSKKSRQKKKQKNLHESNRTISRRLLGNEGKGNTVQGTTSKNTPSDTFIDGSKLKSIEILVLPKRGAVLQLILPLAQSESNEVECNNDHQQELDSVTMETIISVPDEAIGICIVDQ